ncbi:ATP-binding protein [Rhodoflexus caldus]|uniref:ATP-binding protein n=1 Tax=Rhodoflexus caldus TaxID=2891236 RepID=UPI002029C10B|nr:ATP-binding protein [Rhodoflexus caldus]
MEPQSITDVLQEILDVADDCYLLFEGNHIVYASKAVMNIWQCTPEDLLDNNDIFWQSFEPNELNQLRKNWATKIPFKQTCRIKQPNNESAILWVELNARRTNANRIMLRVRNVSEWLAREAESRSIYEEVIHLNENLSNHQEELKASLEELRETNHQLEYHRNQLDFIIKNASEAICTLDNFGRLTMMNHAGMELLQLTPHKVQLHYLVNFLAREYRKELAGFIVGHQVNALPIWTKESVQQVCYLEVVMRNTRGDEFPAKLSLSRINTPSENYFIAVITDLTEVKRAQQALVETEKLIRKVAESIPDLLFLYDVNSNSFTFQNEHLNDFFGDNAKYFTPFRLEKVAELVHPEDLDTLERSVGQVVSGRVGMVEVEFRLRNPNQSGYKWMQLRHAVFSKDQERVTRILGLLQDIDDRKHREMELEQAKQEAEQAVIAKSQFLSTMSHEIRTPMNAVIGMANLLMYEVKDPQQLEKIKILKFAADNLMVILNDVLDFNKLESGKLELELLTFNIKELLHGLEQLFQPKAQEKSLALKLKLDARTPLHVVGDAVRLSQVLSNLLSNAIKFTEKGEVCLTTELLTLQHDTVTIRFEVRDTGIGIPQAQQQRIFERFAQASPEISKKYGGTGLGLAISKLLVEAQGGRLVVESTEGKGATFSFVLTFPLASEQQSSVLHTDDNASILLQDLSGCRILVAEDNHVNQLVVRQYLQNWNATFAFAETGQQVYEKLADEHFDLLLLDLQLPDTDGYTIAETIRKKEGKYSAQMPIIAFSADSGQAMIDKVFRSGMNDYVPKPFRPNDLFDKLAHYLGISPLHFGDATQDDAANATHKAEGGESELISLAPFIAQIGQEEFMRDFIRLNLESLEQFPIEYRAAIEKHDTEMLSRAVHRMQSNISLLQFHALAQELTAYKNGKAIWEKLQPEQLEEHLAQVENLCYRAATILKRVSGK